MTLEEAKQLKCGDVVLVDCGEPEQTAEITIDKVRITGDTVKIIDDCGEWLEVHHNQITRA
jgi:hypothetical protein